MKIFVCADMEGATGVVHRDQLVPEGGEPYRAGCRLLTQDIVAVIEGVVPALSGRPFEVVVSEGHAHMRNVRIEDLPANTRLVCGPARHAQKPLCQIAGLDASFDLAFFMGFHSRAGTPGGLLSHTWAGAIVHELRVNGRPFGETAINAAICGDLGVPVGLVAGADDLCREAAADLGDDVERVETKRALGYNLAECWGPRATVPRLREAAARAITRHLASPRPVFHVQGPVTAELDTHRREMCDKMALVAGLERVGERTVRVVAPTATQALSTLWHGINEAFREPAAWLA